MLQETEQKSLDMELRGKLEGCNQQMEEYKVKGYTYTPFILFLCVLLLLRTSVCMWEGAGAFFQTS